MAEAVTIGSVARVCRSKNAGAALLTVDVSFDEAHWYEQAKGALTPDAIARLYGVSPADVTRVLWDDMRTIKITFPRSPTAGAPGDRDVYGCQQHAPVLGVSLTDS